jgi:outer membrane protein OmpA-like peptidoglycan-associated protein
MRKATLSTSIGVVIGSLFISGCATKRYVRNTVAPIEKKLDATNEIATAADNQAKGAMSKANQNARDLSELQNVVANIDDYESINKTVVHFSLNKDSLAKNEMAKLNALAAQLGGLQRYFITVEGFTDQTGPQSYNDQLSRQRANQVISYLVGVHDIPVYRIHMVGLGDQKLIDDGISMKAREESRRVEINTYTAKPLTASGTGPN